MSVTLREQIAPPRLGRDLRWPWFTLLGLLASYVVLFCLYYPPLPGIEDEVSFINQGIVFSKGSISAEGAGYADLQDFVVANGRHVSPRNPGRSLLIAPFMRFFGYGSIFFSGALIQLALAVVAGLILTKLGRSPLWAMLVLFHPTLALYSRTIMGDAGAGLGLLLALYAVVALRRPGLWAGLAIGAAAVMRYHAGVCLPFVAAAIAITPAIRRPKREALLCLLAGGAVVLLLIVYNEYVYGDAIGITALGYFSAKFIVRNTIFYTLELLCLWPLMAAAPFVDRSPHRWVVRALIFPIVLMLLPYWYLDRGTSWLQTLVLGLRLMQSALPVWIVCYAIVLGDAARALRLRWSPAFIRTTGVVGGLALLAATTAVFRAHQRHLDEFVQARNAVIARVPQGSLLVANSTMAKLFGIPRPGVNYQLDSFNVDNYPLTLERAAPLEGRHFFLALLPKNSPEEFADFLPPLIKHFDLKQIPVADSQVMLFESRP